MLVKLCPACNEENPISEVICRVCMTNLASVRPVPEGSGNAPPEETQGAARGKTEESLPEPEAASDRTIYAPAVLTLSRLSDGRAIPVADGDVLGRSGDALVFFEDSRTVSRRHARMEFRGGTWRIEDLQSTNGTWVNGKRLEPGQPCPLKAGDVVALSLACEMRVIG
ncbi:MAG: FHA domain-containing protein [Synergistaceae bacterium]|jgi:pSer/pThr/pTyr-binding forkhead associated (FHA) protein|nr:FHA domain-containing protein [Synergistaceae bacterium]